MSYNLTEGGIEEIMSGGRVDSPTLQVLGLKKISGTGGQSADRYRLLLSDGVHSHSSAMLATQLNEKVTNGELDTFAVIRLDKFLCNQIQPDRRVMILLDITISARGDSVGHKIGNPNPYRSAGGTADSVQQGAAPAQQQPQNPPPVTNGHAGGGAAAAAASGNRPPAPAPQSSSNQGAAHGSFYGNRSGAAPNKPYVKSQPTPNAPGGSPVRVHPISSLNPYQNRWTVKARVTSKSSVRTWSNSRGEGKLFSMNLLDESGEIKATAFRDQVDKYYDMIELNKVYYVKKGTLKTADKRYSSIDNDYEMTFNNDTEVIPCDDDSNLPSVTFNFVDINKLENTAPNTVCDVLGVVKQVADITTVTSRSTNKELKKREVELVDQSQVQVRLTLWGQEAEGFAGQGNPVLAVKGARLSDFGGRSLSSLASSQLILNPDLPEAHKLRGWYDSEGHSADFNTYTSDGGAGGAGHATNWKTFGEVKSQNLGTSDKGDYFTAKGTVIFLRKENCMYMACPQADCNKKVVDQANGFYRCEKCQKEYPNYKWRLILSSNLADFSDNQWVTCFQESAETLLGKGADELGRLRTEDESEFDRVFQEASFKQYIFRLRAKMETYNDESRLKTVCLQATPVNYNDYNKKLIADIERMAIA